MTARSQSTLVPVSLRHEKMIITSTLRKYIVRTEYVIQSLKSDLPFSKSNLYILCWLVLSLLILPWFWFCHV